MLDELRALLPYLSRYRRAYALGSLCIVSSVALKLLIPRFLGDAIDTLRGMSEDGAELAGAEQVLRLVAISAATIGLAAVSGAAVRTTSRLLILGTSRRVVHDMRNVVFAHLLRLAPSFYARNPTGQILSRCINDMQNVQGLMGPVILYLAETAVLFAIGLTMMLRIDPRLTAIGILPFPIFLVVARKLAVRIQEGSRAAQNSLAEVSAKIDESLSGQAVVKTLAIEDSDRERFSDHCRTYRRLNLAVTRSRAVLIPLMLALTAISTIVVLGLGGPRVASGEMGLGDLVALMLYLQMLAGPTRTLGFVISSLRRGASALGRIREILASEVALVDPPGEAEDGPIAGGLSVRGLSVVHPPPALQPHLTGSLPEMEARGELEGTDPSRRVLDRISFEAPAGTTLAIVGHTGSGKTTLVRALARQLEVEPGRVFVDGVDVTHRSLRELRRAIGYVPQDVFLFSLPLSENVALGRPEASPEEVEDAVRSAHLAVDLPQLPQGLDTIVGERGVNLSGGQRQRAALARVLLLDPRILILDDTLSAVDAHTAEAILSELEPFARSRTTVLVAHRLATVRHADRILVLEEGRLVESGSHAELIALGGRYGTLWAEQQAHQEDRRTGLPGSAEREP